MMMRFNSLARRSLVFGALLAFVGAGVAIGFYTQRDTESTSAANEAAADIRYIEAVQESYDPDGNVVPGSARGTLVWLDSDGSRMRVESLDEAGEVAQTIVLKGNTVLTLRSRPGSMTYSELRVLPPYEEPVRENRRPRFLKDAEGLAAGELTEVARDAEGGQTLVTVRAERAAADAEPLGESEGPPVTAYEAVFDAESGLTVEQRVYTTASDGSYELLGTIRYEYPVDTMVAGEDVFTLEPPDGAMIYRDIQLTPGEVASFAPFTLYQLGSEFHGSPLSEAQESRRENTPIRETHLVNFVYEDAGLTVINQSAASLAGVPRCEDGEAVAPGSIGDVVLEGNRACGYGEEVMTDLGPAVLRSDSTTVEIQLGQTVVFVHAEDAETALEAVNLLSAAN